MDSSKDVALKRSFGIPPLRNSIITGKTKREILIGINDRARSEIRAKELVNVCVNNNFSTSYGIKFFPNERIERTKVLRPVILQP